MSVPGVFDPMEWGDALLVDDGIVNNVPANVVRNMGADILIVVEVGSGLTISISVAVSENPAEIT